MQTEEKCLSCQARLQENECTCLFEKWNFSLETEGYICNFSIHHNAACCELNDSFMELNLLHANDNSRLPVYYKRREKLKHDLFKNNLSVLNYEGDTGRYSMLNTLKYREYPQINTIKFEGAVGRYQNFTAAIWNISKPRIITGNTPVNKQAENKIDWFITEEYTGITKFIFPCDRIHLSGPLSFQYSAHGINKPLPVIA